MKYNGDFTWHSAEDMDVSSLHLLQVDDYGIDFRQIQ